MNIKADQNLGEHCAQGEGGTGGTRGQGEGRGGPFSVDFSSCKLSPGYY